MSIDWPGFHMNNDVKAMPVATRGVYLLLLGELWMNGGWLPNDDKLIARRLDMDVRAWRQHRKHIAPCLTEVSEKSRTLPCGMIVQNRLTREYEHTLELVDKKRAQTEPARAKRHAKSKAPASATEENRPPATAPVTEPVTKAETAPAAASVTAGEAEAEKKEALLPNSRELLSSTPTAGDGSLRPAPKREAEGSAAVGSPGREGRSPPQPSERVPAPTPALLRSKLVKNGGKHDPEPSDDPDRGGGDDDQGELPEPSRARRGDAGAVGLFGALEAAIRRGKGGEGET